MRTILILLALAAFAIPAPGGVEDAEWKEISKTFKDEFKKKSIAFKISAIESLPLKDERTIDFIIKDQKLLNSSDWMIRMKAADRLSKILTPELRKKVLVYAKDRDVKIREGIYLALAFGHDPTLDVPVILEGLNDTAWEIRRLALFAAGQQRVREAVEKMISMIHEVDRDGKVRQEGETHPRVRGPLLFNLEEITGKYFHTDVAQWKDYWEKNKDRTLPPVKRFDVADFGDVKLEFNETFARRGSGPLVIVLPDLNLVTTYYMPYFNQWMFVKWLFINMPPIRSFPNVQINEHGDPIYPVDMLVDAFEEKRKKENVEKTALLTHGWTSWVAAKYAEKYPDRISGLILLEPYATDDTYGAHIDAAKRSGDPDAEFWAKVSSYEIKAATQLEGDKYDWYRYSCWLHDRSDVEIGVLMKIWPLDGASSTQIPEFDIRGENQSNIPCLMFFSEEKNALSGFGDIKRLQKNFPKSIVVKLRKSARLPFMEEPDKFEEALRMFVDKYQLQ
jgi:pimeloyl-ACP methyl ester carboxylesterase